jgi:spermidine synthase
MPDTIRHKSIYWLLLIYFLSGPCALINEVVWVRLLKLTIGNTVYATSIVVSVFLGGLAIGSLIMSKYADNISKPIRLYALLETFVAMFTLLVPHVLKIGDQGYVWFYRHYNPTNAQLLIVQAIISSIIILIPTIMMGSTLPLLARFVTSSERETGRLVGKLYAFNTLGAAIGCYMAGFVLIRSFGVMGTLYAASSINVLVALAGWLLSYFAIEGNKEQTTTSIIESSPHSFKWNELNGKFFVMVFSFSMSGFIGIGYELLWMRSIIYLLGGFTYVFSAVLTVYLLGNVIGVAIGSTLSGKVKEPAVGFAICLSVTGLSGILYLPLLIFSGPKASVLNSLFSKLPLLGH